jgi:asparagine synthase (glutamine-hydrolysing)
MLRAQRRYGTNRPFIRGFDEAAFGIDLCPTVPEDSFDRQPWREGDHLLVADIRLDNRDELIRSLGMSHSEAVQSADSEIFLHAWRRWGKDSLRRIVGDFAMALFDRSTHTLYLARDPVGERPLFFSCNAHKVAFASMPTGILSLPAFRRGFDLLSLASAAGDIRPPDDRTYFESVHRVLPGQLVTVNATGVRTSNYWSPERTELKLGCPDEYAEAYRGVLEEAVKPRLRRLSGPVAAHLSSGLDSSAVASTAAQLNPAEQVLAFTAAPALGFRGINPRGRTADESEAASLTARMNGMQHFVVRTGGSGISQIKAFVSNSQEPRCNIINLGWGSAIEQLARNEGARVLLSGEFGNSTLNAGGLNVLGDLVYRLQWRRWLQEARQTTRHSYARWTGVLINSFEPWLPRPARRALYRIRFQCGRRSESVFLRKQWIDALGNRLESGFLPDRGHDSYEDRLAFLPLTESGALRKGSLARHGIDNRSPLGDRRVIEFSLRLPREQLFSGGISRPLARAALADRVPTEVLNQRVRGYQAADWFEQVDVGEIRNMLEEIASNGTARQLIDVDKIQHSLDDWQSRGVKEFGTYQRLAIDLPLALGTGLFIVEAEKWLAGKFD